MDMMHLQKIAPAGAIASSVNDMSKWMQTWLNKGKFKDEQIFTTMYANDAMSSHAVLWGGLPDESQPDVSIYNYGYAWMISNYKGLYAVHHGGATYGFRSQVTLLPMSDIRIVVLSNQHHATVPDLITEVVINKLFGFDSYVEEESKKGLEEREQWGSDIRDRQKHKAQGVAPERPLTEFTGTFQHPAFGKFDIKLENDSLIAYMGN